MGGEVVILSNKIQNLTKLWLKYSNPKSYTRLYSGIFFLWWDLAASSFLILFKGSEGGEADVYVPSHTSPCYFTLLKGF